jgi:succinate dehydrogenase/fumarate reductase flavoprotein subunit
MADYETHEHDVLVIGAGGARAAIEASGAGATSRLTRSKYR